MSKKKTKLDIDGLKNLESTLTELTSDLEEKLKPMLNFDKLQDTLNNFTDIVNNRDKTKGKAKDEGETCMHDNSWHSNCSDCEELNTIDDLFTLVENTPNDMELGKKIRQIYWAYTNSDADSGDEPSDEQLNLFDDPVTKDRKRWGG